MPHTTTLPQHPQQQLAPPCSPSLTCLLTSRLAQPCSSRVEQAKNPTVGVHKHELRRLQAPFLLCSQMRGLPSADQAGNGTADAMGRRGSILAALDNLSLLEALAAHLSCTLHVAT